MYLARGGIYLNCHIPAQLAPKSIFCDYLFTLIRIKNWELVHDHKAIIDTFLKFGDLKYFFPLSSYIRLIYSI